MKVIISLFLLFLTSKTLAYYISLEGRVNLSDCKADSNEETFRCKKGDKEYLIYDHDKGYSAVEYDNGKIRKLKVEAIDSERHNVFESSRSLSSSRNYRTGPFIDYTQSTLPILNDYFKGELNSSQVSEFKDLEGKIANVIRAQNQKYDDAFKSNLLNISLKNGEQKKCQRYPQNRRCPILFCGKDSRGNNLLLYKNTSKDDASLNLFSFKNGTISKNSASLESIRAYNGLLLENSISDSDNNFSRDKFVPSHYKNSPATFEYLTRKNLATHMMNQLYACGEKVFRTFNSEIQNAFDRYENDKMVQLIDFTNDGIKSYYVNTDSLAGKCTKDGRYYSPEAYEQLLETVPSENGAITIEEANELFKIGKNMPNMAWHVIENGCYARSHLMAKEFEKRGINVQKAWLTGKLKIPGVDNNNWNYHTAPLVYVKDKDGNKKQMIIDPALSDGPITVQEWMNKVGVREAKTVGYPSPLNSRNYAGATLSISSTKPYLRVYNTQMSEEAKIEDARDTLIDYERGRFNW